MERLELIPYMHLAHAIIKLQKVDDELGIYSFTNDTIKTKLRDHIRNECFDGSLREVSWEADVVGPIRTPGNPSQRVCLQSRAAGTATCANPDSAYTHQQLHS